VKNQRSHQRLTLLPAKTRIVAYFFFFLKKRNKNFLLVLGPRARWSGSKKPKPTLWWRHVTPQKISNPRLTNFSIETRTFCIFLEFGQLSSSTCRQVTTGRSHSYYSGFAVLQGFRTTGWLCNAYSAKQKMANINCWRYQYILLAGVSPRFKVPLFKIYCCCEKRPEPCRPYAVTCSKLLKHRCFPNVWWILRVG